MSSNTAPAHPPPQVINDEDQGALVTVMTATLLTWTLLTFFIRIAIRARLNGPWSHDDTVIAGATLIATVQSIATFVLVNQGYGRRTALIDSTSQASIARTFYALQILYLTAVALSRVSTALLISRLTHRQRHRLATRVLCVLCAVWGIVAILIICLRCNLSHPWTVSTAAGSFCISPYTRWLGVEIVSMFLELGIFGLSIFLVWGLQLASRLKLIVIGAFFCRPLVIVPLAFRVTYLRPGFFDSDPFYNGVYATVFTQVAMHYAIIAATLPVAKPFVRAFHSGYMDPEGYTVGSAVKGDPSLHASNPRSGSYALHNLSNSSRRSRGVSLLGPSRLSIPHTGEDHSRTRGSAQESSDHSPLSQKQFSFRSAKPFSPISHNEASPTASRYLSGHQLQTSRGPLPVPRPANDRRSQASPCTSRRSSRGAPDGSDLPYSGEGVVETRIEHDPYATPASYDLAFPASRARRKKDIVRGGRGKSRDQRTGRVDGDEELIIQRTRDLEVTYESKIDGSGVHGI